MLDYHRYGALLTSDGSAAQYLERNWLIMGAGAGAPPAGRTYNMYNKHVRVWSCANWQNAMCNGSTLLSSGGLTYWH